MTDDAMLIIDPKAQIIRHASPQAMDLIGPTLRTEDTPLGDVFLNEGNDLGAFLAGALSVTDPLLSGVTLAPDKRTLSAKGSRLSLDDGSALVLLLLEAEPELSSRFRLLADKIEELRAEVIRRVAAEKGQTEYIDSLHRSVSVIKQLAELDVSSGDYLDMTAAVISSSFQSHGTAVIAENLGKLRVLAATGVFADIFPNQPTLGLSLTEFTGFSEAQADRWKELLVSHMQHAGADHVSFANALVMPLPVGGKVRGALICLMANDGQGRTNVRLESDLISEAIGGLMARAEIEAQLMHAQKLHAIGQLTGGIAHDFNNILAVVLGNAELLLYELDSIDMDVAREIREAAIRGATLTSRLLSFARKQPLQPVPTDFNRLLREFDPMIRRTIKENISLEIVSSAGLWISQVDRNQLENAVLNLAVNARDAMPSGGLLTIETANTRLDNEYAERHSEVRAGQYVMIAVSDTGEGMTPEVAREAFTPFFTTKEVGLGSGLGLSMVFGFVKQSLGHVKIYSEAGVGTTVRMYFPRDLTELENVDTGDATSHESMPPAMGHILLVEDDTGVLRYLTRSLELLGYTVDGVTTAEKAIELLQGQRFDLLLSDVILPGGKGGAELAKVAFELAPDMPVLLMSGYTENSIVHHGRLDVGVEFISKPFTREQIAKRLKGLLAR
ncbi:response regulator [Pseudosulfitobacter koreensis]|uniref:histidine kinase n=1 Tax=Pseudosulfitobacter koreensis TaxID=2968472 RepID=A0ABT1Z2M0_9RHOB|nr:response regulator [Pseudosulfitobacter koreense]MCR8827377.1 response regulator [Pseudosulfitobacter koreense]